MISFRISFHWARDGMSFGVGHWKIGPGIHHWWLDLWVIGFEVTID